MVAKTQSPADGVVLHEIETDKFKTAQLAVFFVLPLTDARTAAHCSLLPPVLRRGSRTYPTATALSRRLEELYAADLSAVVFRRGEFLVLSVSVDTVKAAYLPEPIELQAEAAGVLVDLLTNPLTEGEDAFTASYVEGEKKNCCDRIRSKRNNKAAYAKARCVEIMCEGEAYGIPESGGIDAVNAITPRSLFAFYRELLRTARIEVYCAGGVPLEEAATWLRPLWSGAREPVSLLPCEAQGRTGRIKRVKERSAAVQGKLCIGFRTGVTLGGEDRAAFMLFHFLYGASPSSKLFANVREKLSLCYSCSATQDLAKGVLFVSAGIENRKARRALREILHQLRRIRAGRFTERERFLALQTLKSQYLAVSDDPWSLMLWSLSRRLCGVSDSPEEAIAALERVSDEQIRAIAKQVEPDTVYFLEGVGEGSEEDEDD